MAYPDGKEVRINAFGEESIFTDRAVCPKDPRSKHKYNILFRIFFLKNELEKRSLHESDIIEHEERQISRPETTLAAMKRWLEGIFFTGYQRDLKQSDIYAHPSEADSEQLLKKFNKYWQKELHRKEKGLKPRLWVVIAKCFWWRILLQGFLSFLELTLRIGQAVVLGYVTRYFSLPCDERTSPEETRNAYLFAAGLVLLWFVITLVHQHGYLTGEKIGMMSRVMMTSAIYNKVLSLSQVTVGEISTGHIVNLASNDVQRFDLAFVFIHSTWLAPALIVVITYIMYTQVGWASLVPAAVVLLQVPLQIGLAKLFSKLRLKSAEKTDQRVCVMSDIINGIRIIKMYAWEYAFKKVVSALRKHESRLIRKGGLIRALSSTYGSSGILQLMQGLTFIVFLAISSGEELTAQRVFSSLALLSLLRRIGGAHLIKSIFLTHELKVAIQRIQKFLLLEEITLNQSKGKSIIKDGKVVRASTRVTESSHSMVSVNHLTALWQDKTVLKDISFNLDKDAPLLTVVGPVGSGKSTLLQCLLGELELLEGSVKMNGRVSYASQQPWVFTGNVRENILFGLPYQKERYKKVIKACALDKDIESMIRGDLTPVGENGASLSGGQKARVNLARAVYRQADIYLLDDPLSAVDASVGKHLFDECIRDFLNDKVIILVTHQIDFALQGDMLLVLNNGEVQDYGSRAELAERKLDTTQLFGLLYEKDERGDFAYKEDEDSEEECDEFLPLGRRKFSVLGNAGPTRHRRASCMSVAAPNPNRYRKISCMSMAGSRPGRYRKTSCISMAEDPLPARYRRASCVSSAEAEKLPRHRRLSCRTTEDDQVSLHSAFALDSEEPRSRRESVMFDDLYGAAPAEEISTGSISTMTYVRYFRAGGHCLILFFVLVLFVLAEISIVTTDWWISEWATCLQSNQTSLEEPNNSTCQRGTESGVTGSPMCSLSESKRLVTYSLLLVSSLILNFVRGGLFYLVCVNASRVLHNRMFKTILRVPVLFFDTNPSGQVLNRFSKDVGFLDDLLPQTFLDYSLRIIRSMAILLVASAANPYILLPLPLILFAFLAIRWYFLKTSRSVKRLEAVARSPVYSHISTTLQGLSTIRTFAQQDIATSHFHTFNNEHTQGWYLFMVMNRWFRMRLSFITALIPIAVAFISIPLVSSADSDLDPALLSLGLTYTISLAATFQFCIAQSAEVENIMISAERVMEYSHLESEAPPDASPSDQKPLDDWPSKGELHMEEVAFRYSAELPLVLRNLTFSIRPSERVGIVGRTGAGKSSLLSVLYRLAEPYGKITIDGVDTDDIGLYDLRKKMSIIPQDPVLFCGSVRYNLDPFEEFSDAKLWDVLEQVQLKEEVQEMEGQLSGEVTEGGSNFSVGQRQLVCLARVLLRKNKILILDEATANVDPKTDEVIQAAIRNNFSESTVLTIAHRLNTIMDSNRILVMGDGKVLEYDSPLALLENKKSEFYAMVEKMGAEASHRLHQMAKEADREKKLNKKAKF